jgi:hypothetical protein
MTSNWKWEFDPVAMTLSFGGITVATLLCERNSPEIAKTGIDVSDFVEAQESVGAQIAATLNHLKLRHPLALATVTIKGAKQ